MRKIIWLIAMLVVAAPRVFSGEGMMQPKAASHNKDATERAPQFDVVTITPNPSTSDRYWVEGDRKSNWSFIGKNMTVSTLIQIAYGVKGNRIYGGPDWFTSEKYDLDARTSKTMTKRLKKVHPEKPTWPEKQSMLRALLEERFQLKSHREVKDSPVFWLTVAEPGKLQVDNGNCPPAQPPEPGKPPVVACGRMHFSKGPTGGSHVVGEKTPLAEIVTVLSNNTGQIVVDRTGLTGKYDIQLDLGKRAQDEQRTALGAVNNPPPASEVETNPWVIAVREQLGLKLDAGKGPVEVLAIDHVERFAEK